MWLPKRDKKIEHEGKCGLSVRGSESHSMESGVTFPRGILSTAEEQCLRILGKIRQISGPKMPGFDSIDREFMGLLACEWQSQLRRITLKMEEIAKSLVDRGQNPDKLICN
jgi:hypothetical protein